MIKIRMSGLAATILPVLLISCRGGPAPTAVPQYPQSLRSLQLQTINVPDRAGTGVKSVLTYRDPTTGAIKRLPSGTRIYELRAFSIYDGRTLYSFPATANYRKTSTGIVVTAGGGTTTFPASSTLSTTTDYAFVYPGQKSPGFVRGMKVTYVVP